MTDLLVFHSTYVLLPAKRRCYDAMRWRQVAKKVTEWRMGETVESLVAHWIQHYLVLELDVSTVPIKGSFRQVKCWPTDSEAVQRSETRE